MGDDRRHRLPARRLRRGPAHPPRGRAAGLRAPRRHPLRRRHQGQDRRHAYQRGDSTRPCASAARRSCRSTSASARSAQPPSPGAQIADMPTSAASSTRPCASAARSSCRSTSGSATPASAPSPGARSPTSPTSAATRRGAAHPPRGGAAGLRAARRHPLARRHLGPDRRHAYRPRRTTTRPCASAARTSCRSTSGSATSASRRHLGQDRRHA